MSSNVSPKHVTRPCLGRAHSPVEDQTTAGILNFDQLVTKPEERLRERYAESTKGKKSAPISSELLEICARIEDNKAPGLNGVPNKTLKLAVKS